MFLVRSAQSKDLDELYELSKLVFFINLPRDKTEIRKILEASHKSFTQPSRDLAKNHYLFVLEDLSNHKICGASLIHAQHGTINEPHFFLTVGQEHKYSQTMNTGFIHGTLKLGYTTDGPTEIGGLVLHPSYRGSPFKLGKLLSFARFLFMGLNMDKFKNEVHAELMPPLDKNGNSPLWEAIGRRFMNMNYLEADKLSRTNKEFILALYPSNNIYQTLLPIEARESIGKVGEETLPVERMLKSIGFRYVNEVDPFDGGPHFRCKLQKIAIIKNIKSFKLQYANAADTSMTNYLIYRACDEGFSCFQTTATQVDNKLLVPKDIASFFKLSESSPLTATPLS